MLTVASPMSQVVVWLLVTVLSSGGIFARIPACCLRVEVAEGPACCVQGEVPLSADEAPDLCCPSKPVEPVRLPDCRCELAPLESFWASPQSWEGDSQIGEPRVAFDNAELAAASPPALLEQLAARSPQVPFRVLFCTWLI